MLLDTLSCYSWIKLLHLNYHAQLEFYNQYSCFCACVFESLTEVNVSLHSGIVILMWKGKTVSLCVCVQDHCDVWRLLHRWTTLLVPVRPHWLLQLCVLPTERWKTVVSSGSPRGMIRTSDFKNDNMSICFFVNSEVVVMHLEAGLLFVLIIIVVICATVPCGVAITFHSPFSQ